ncbi:kinesin motor domain-containing protein [Cyclospora cayetanensis]|uniref:Kinesin-like protein n=1 Tax=Cyclospora cayetanensis TaxID=88456 RepID=A0A1D3D7I3_9EIME|nr:kinesin motor domain-containing protein [Cyclospora cayetanensis]
MEAPVTAEPPETADGPTSERVRVIIRCRPLSESETAEGCQCVVMVNSKNASVCLQKPKGPTKHFTFDAVYDASVSQDDVYDDAAFGIVESVTEGYNGQKWWITEHLSPLHAFVPQTFLVRASFLELYNEEARDLLSKTPTAKLILRDSPDCGVFAEGLTTFTVKSAEELTKLLATGQQNRKVGATQMNAASSRSHSIFIMEVESADKDGRVRMGKLNLVDLAGSERQAKAGSTGERFREARKINLSLSALGNVISALAENSPFIPYRDSKLTRILQASLGGNTRTTMVANVGPACTHYDETLSTLRYAQRTKHIKNAPHVNENPKQAMILAFKEEIAWLKQQLHAAEQARLLAVKNSHEKPTEIVVEKPIIIEKEVIKEKPMMVEKVVEKIKIVDVSKEEKRRLEEENLQQQQQLRASFEAERNAIELARRKAEEDLKAQEMETALYKQRQAELTARLTEMEAQLLRGNTEISRAKQQQRELKKTQLRLEEQKKMEEQLRRERDQGQEATLLLESLVTSKDKELHNLSSKVQQLCWRYKEAVDDIEDLQKEFQAERESLLHDIRSTQLEIRLQQSIIDRFIPPEERIRSLASWDEAQGEWVIPHSDLAGKGMMIQRAASLVMSNRRRPTRESGNNTHGASMRMRADPIIEASFSFGGESFSAAESCSSSARAGEVLDNALTYVEKHYFQEYPGCTHSSAAEVRTDPREILRFSKRLLVPQSLWQEPCVGGTIWHMQVMGQRASNKLQPNRLGFNCLPNVLDILTSFDCYTQDLKGVGALKHLARHSLQRGAHGPPSSLVVYSGHRFEVETTGRDKDIVL